MQKSLLVSVSLLAVLGAHAASAQEMVEEEIVITGQRAQQQRSIEEKREALGIMDVAAADEIGQLPDKNVAEVIERLPGVGVQYDQGEGRYVAVRGIPSSLNGYTLNGFEIGNPDGTTRSLPLDIMSGQLLNRVEVSKVKTADLIGQGIGATINLVPQTAFDFDKPFTLSANAQVGYQELRKGDQPIRGDITIGGRFGSDEQFGILVGASYSDRTFTSYGIYPDNWNPDAVAVSGAPARGAVPTNIKYTDYSLKRERIGLSGSLDWRGESTELYLRGIYSKFTEDEYRQRFRLDFSNITWDANGLTGMAAMSEQRSDLRLEYKEKSILAFMAGGTTRFGEDWTIDYGAARIHNEVIEPNELWQFRGTPTADANGKRVALDFTDKLYTAVPVNGYLAPSSMGFRSYTAQDESGEEDTWQFRTDLKRSLALGMNSFLKIGANVRLTDKSFDGQNDSYTRGTAPNRFTMDGLAGEDVIVKPGGGHNYLLSPAIDADLIRAYTDGKLGGAQFVLDTATSLANATLNDFSLDEDVYAGYAMANLDFGDIALTAGMRIERTKLSITGFRLENDTDVVSTSGSRSYTDFLPSLVVRITPSDETVFRIAYSRSVGRPQYADLSPGGELTYEPIGDGTFEGGISLGNPNLKPYIADSLDATAEWYFAPGGLIYVGAFAKFIKNPIFTESYTLFDTSFGGRDFATLSFSQQQNAEKGDIIGLEAAYQQQFTFLPGLLSGFGVNLNVALIDGNLRNPGRGSTDFPEQSKLLWGAQLFYQKGIVEASVAYHHTGRALLSVADEAFADEYNDDLRRLDAKVAFDITPNVRVFAEGQNLTDEPTRQYQGGVRNRVIQNERYGRTFNVGASLRW